MDIRRAWTGRETELKASYEAILSRAEEGEKVSVDEAWAATIPFERPRKSTGYLPGRGDIVLGVLPFYDFLYVPISYQIIDEDDFRRGYGIDTSYFLDLTEAGKLVPVFPATSDLYPDFVRNKIWSYLEVQCLTYLSAWQLNAISVAFQSASGVMLPWDQPTKDPWWTEMMIKASALDSRLIADFPRDPAKFAASRADFDRLPPEIKSNVSPLDSEKLDYIAHTLSMSLCPSIPASKYIEILDGRTTQVLRNLLESATTLERVSGERILELCKQYNNQIEDVARSKGYKLARVASDLFTKHVLAISLGIAAGAVGGLVPGLAGLIVGEVTLKLAGATDQKSDKLRKRTARTMTQALAKLLGKDSDLVHLCLAREALRKAKSSVNVP